MTSRLIHCHLQPDEHGAIDQLQDLNCPDAGIVTVLAALDTHAYARQVAAEILTQVGKPSTLGGNGALSIDPWGLVPLWLAAAGIEHLVIIDAQRLGRGRTADLCGLAYELDLTLWLITREPMRWHWAGPIDEWPVEALSWTETSCQLPHPPAAPHRPAPIGFDLVHLPVSDVFTFRAEACRLNSPEVFAAIDAVYVAAAQDTVARFHATAASQAGVESLLTELLARHPSAAARLAATRGLQAGLLRRGWHLGVAVDSFTTLCGEIPSRLPDDDPRWDALGGWWQPHRGATCALSALGIDAEMIATLPCGAVTPQAVALPAGETVAVPAGAWRLLAPQLLARYADGAGASSRFLVGPDGSPPVDADWVAIIVRQAADAGITLPVRRRGQNLTWDDGGSLFRRLGLRLQHLRLGDTPFDTTDLDATTCLSETVPGGATGDNRPAGPQAIDGSFIASRRREHGRPRRELARRAGLTERALEQLEAGEVPTRMYLERLLKLAAALDAHPAQLLGGAPPAPVTSPDPALDVQGDASSLGALLHRVGRPAPVDAVASSLGWDLPRLSAAATALAAASAGTGLSVLCDGGDIGWVRDSRVPVAADVLAEVVHRQDLRRGVGLHRVKLLVSIANGTFKANSYGGARVDPHLHHLRNAQLIETDPARPGGAPRIVDDVRFSLMLPAGQPSRPTS